MSASLSSRALIAAAVCAVIAACLVLLAVAPAFAAFPGANGKIAFSKDGKIHAVNPTSGAVSTLGKSLVNGSWPTWSADGKQVAFVGGGGIAVAKVSGGAARTIVRSGMPVQIDPYAHGVVGLPLGLSGNVTWSPDGRKIAFTGGVPGRGEFDHGGNGIFTINVNGTGLTMWTYVDNWQLPHLRPAWSPNRPSHTIGGRARAGATESRASRSSLMRSSSA